MFEKKILGSWVWILLSTSISLEVSAAQIGFEFEATIHQSNSSTGLNVHPEFVELEQVFAIGEKISGRLFYDSESLPTWTDSDAGGTAARYEPLYFEVWKGPFRASTDGGEIFVHDGYSPGLDQFGVSAAIYDSVLNVVGVSAPLLVMGFGIYDSDREMLDSSDLPTQAIAERYYLADSQVSLSFFADSSDYNSESYWVNAGIDSLTLTVDEPVVEISLPNGPSQECTLPLAANVQLEAEYILPVGDPIQSIEWSVDGIGVATGDPVMIELPLGDSEITVQVETITGLVGSATVDVAVVDTIPPQLTHRFIDSKGEQVISIDTGGLNAIELVTTAVDQCDPNPVVSAFGGVDLITHPVVKIKKSLGEVRLETTMFDVLINAVDVSGNTRTVTDGLLIE